MTAWLDGIGGWTSALGLLAGIGGLWAAIAAALNAKSASTAANAARVAVQRARGGDDVADLLREAEEASICLGQGDFAQARRIVAKLTRDAQVWAARSGPLYDTETLQASDAALSAIGAWDDHLGLMGDDPILDRGTVAISRGRGAVTAIARLMGRVRVLVETAATESGTQ